MSVLPFPSHPAEYLRGLTARSQADQLADPSPQRAAALLAELGDPHRRYPAIHVTGTNGKGSTATMAAGLLAGEGLRVGLYTGPDLSRVNERIAINGRPVTDQELHDALRRVARAAARSAITPGWFEALTVAALWLFAQRRVDAAVVEVGMLGRLDATNVLSARTVVVTNVELDHEAEAGGGRTAIAAEKAGILHPGATLVLGETDAALRPAFVARAPGRILEVGRDLTWGRRRSSLWGSIVDLETPWGLRRDIPVGMLGAHQCHNALMALAAAEAFLDRPVPAAAARSALRRTRVPGRFEIRGRAPLLVLDGAHNAAAARALRNAVTEISEGMTPRVLVYGLRRGRDPAAFLRQCGVQHVDLIVVTEVDDAPAVCEEQAAAAAEFGARLAVVHDCCEAVRYAVQVAGPRGLVVATGSLRLVGRVREAPLDAEATDEGVVSA